MSAWDRIRALALGKEGPEQRRLLLAAGSVLLIVWAASLAVTLLAPRGAGGGWLGAWAGYGFPVAAFLVLVPAHALLAGSWALSEHPRTGSLEFLLARPVRGSEVWAAKFLAALGASLLLTATAWLSEVALWLLAGAEASPPFILLLAATPLIVFPPLGAGLLGGALGRSRAPATLLGLGLLAAGVAASFLPYRLALEPEAWPSPGWYTVQAAALLFLLGSLALTENRAGARVSRTVPVILLLLTAALLGRGLWQADAEHLSPREVESVSVASASPDGRSIAIQPGKPWERLWRWETPGRDRRAILRRLPGRETEPVGWGVDGTFYYLRRQGGGRLLMASRQNGAVEPLLELERAPGPETYGWGPSQVVADPLGRIFYLDGPSETIWLPEEGIQAAEAPGAQQIAGWWGDSLLVSGSDGAWALSPGRDRVRRLEGGGDPLPLRSGRYLAHLRATGDEGTPASRRWWAVWDEEAGADVADMGDSDRCTPAWAHHLQTLYFCRGATLTAWHPDVGERALMEPVRRFRLLPDGARLLVETSEGCSVLHAGTRRIVPVAVPEGLDPFDARRLAFSPDGTRMAVGGSGGLAFVDTATGIRDPADPALVETLWLHWVKGGAGEGADLLVQAGPRFFALVDPEGGTSVYDLVGGPPVKEVR